MLIKDGLLYDGNFLSNRLGVLAETIQLSQHLGSLLRTIFLYEPTGRFWEQEYEADHNNSEKPLEGNWEAPVDRVILHIEQAEFDPGCDNDSSNGEPSF